MPILKRQYQSNKSLNPRKALILKNFHNKINNIENNSHLEITFSYKTMKNIHLTLKVLEFHFIK